MDPVLDLETHGMGPPRDAGRARSPGASDKDLERLAELTDRYCVVGQSLTPHPAIRVVRATLR